MNIAMIDGRVEEYTADDLSTYNGMLAKYDLILGQQVIWRNADNVPFQGSILRIDEDEGDGHFIIIRNIAGGDSAVPVSLIESVKDVYGVFRAFDKNPDVGDAITRVYNDIEVSIDPELKPQRMVIAATNANGEPDFAFVKVRVTDEERDNGDDYEKAKEWAAENDYEEPMVAFNCEVDSAGMAIADLFKWESASTI